MSDNKVIPAEAIEAAANAISESSGMRFDGFWSRVEDLEPEDREYALREARAALEAAAPYMMAEVWQSAYDQGVDDERTSQANPGIAGCFCHKSPCRCFIAPARENPFSTSR